MLVSIILRVLSCTCHKMFFILYFNGTTLLIITVFNINFPVCIISSHFNRKPMCGGSQFCYNLSSMVVFIEVQVCFVFTVSLKMQYVRGLFPCLSERFYFLTSWLHFVSKMLFIFLTDFDFSVVLLPISMSFIVWPNIFSLFIRWSRFCSHDFLLLFIISTLHRLAFFTMALPYLLVLSNF